MAWLVPFDCVSCRLTAFVPTRLSAVNLKPEEIPDMSFQADVRPLRQAITSFGTIATQVWVRAQLPTHIQVAR